MYKVDINILPVELLEIIFKNLPSADILIMRKVCKLWRQVSEKELIKRQLIYIDFNQLYRLCVSDMSISDFRLFINAKHIKINFQYKEFEDQNYKIMKLIESLKNLKTIYLTRVYDVPSELTCTHCCEKFTNLLERLDIKTDTRLNYETFSQLQTLHIHWHGNYVSAQDWAKLVSQLPKLKCYCIMFTENSQSYPTLLEMLQAFSQSNHCQIRLKKIALGSKELCTIDHIKMMKNFERIELFEFSYSNLLCKDEFEAIDIAQTIFECPYLKQFHVNKAQNRQLLEKIFDSNLKRRGVKFLVLDNNFG